MSQVLSEAWMGAGHPQICAAAEARSTSTPEDEGLSFAKCMWGRGTVEEWWEGVEERGKFQR